MVEAHRHSAKHQWVSFHETESTQIFLKHAVYQILQINYLLFHFNRTYQFVFQYCIWICFAFWFQLKMKKI